MIDIETNGGKENGQDIPITNQIEDPKRVGAPYGTDDAQGYVINPQSTQKIPTDGIATNGVIGTDDYHRITVDRGKGPMANQ